MKTTNRLILVFVLFLLVILIGYLVMFLVFPMPKIIDLFPDTAIAYLDVYNFDKNFSLAQNSEFVKRVSESPLWTNFKTTRLWGLIERDIIDLQQNGLDKKTLNRLIGRHAIIALYGLNDSQTKSLGYLLISEVDMPTRLLIASGQIERLISPEYQVSKQKYEGFTLTTIRSPEWEYTYAFAGRAGLLANDAELVKSALDVNKQNSKALPTIPQFGELASSLSSSDISFFINPQRVSQSFPTLQQYGINAQSLSFMSNIGLWAGIADNLEGELRIENFILKNEGGSQANVTDTPLVEKLPLPDDSLAIITHQVKKPEVVFRMMEKYLSPRIYILRRLLLPVVEESLAEVMIAPKALEYQTMPSFLFFLRVRNKLIAEDALRQLKEFLKYLSSQTVFEELEYEGQKISYSNSFPGIYLPVGFGYTILKDDLLVISTDMSTLKTVIDISKGKRQPITKQTQYVNTMISIPEKSDNLIYVNLTDVAPIAQQLSKLYLFQGMLSTKKKSERNERYALMVSDNASIIQSWNNLGAVWYSDSDKFVIKLTLKH